MYVVFSHKNNAYNTEVTMISKDLINIIEILFIQCERFGLGVAYCRLSSGHRTGYILIYASRTIRLHDEIMIRCTIQRYVLVKFIAYNNNVT